jgi:hypothetical protein
VEILREKQQLDEMAIMSSRTDAGLKGIDIAVFSNEHPPKHATILKRGNHRVGVGRFKITPNPPKSHLDIEEVKEEIDPKYKRQIAEWAGKKSVILNGKFNVTNWEALDAIWDVLNHDK